MKFGDLPIGAVFFENSTGEYCLKVSCTMSTVYDFSKKDVFTYNSGHTVDFEFPPDLDVELLE